MSSNAGATTPSPSSSAPVLRAHASAGFQPRPHTAQERGAASLGARRPSSERHPHGASTGRTSPERFLFGVGPGPGAGANRPWARPTTPLASPDAIERPGLVVHTGASGPPVARSGLTPPGLRRLSRSTPPAALGADAPPGDAEVLLAFARLGARGASAQATAARVEVLRSGLEAGPAAALLEASFMLGVTAFGLETPGQREDAGVVVLQVARASVALAQALAGPSPSTQAEAQGCEALLEQIDTFRRSIAAAARRCTDEGTRTAFAYFELALRNTREKYFAAAAPG